MKVANGILEGEYGGVNQHMLNIQRHSRFEPDLLKTSPWSFYLSRNPVKEGIAKYFLRRFRIVGLDIAGKRLARRASREYDIVHLHGHPWWPEAFRRPADRKAKYVHSVHQVYRREDFPDDRAWDYARYLNGLMLESMLDSAAVISVAQWQIPAIGELGSRSIYIPNGTNTGVFESGDGDAFRKKYRIEDDFFLFAGRPSKYKRPEHVVNLAKRQKDLKFVMIGTGVTPEKMARYMDGPIPGNVTCLGEIPFADVINGMSACRVFLLPSMNDTFPTVVMEAMAAGRPVVASDNAGPKEILRDGVDGQLFIPDDLDSIETAAMKAWDNPGLGENGRKRVKERFDWKVITPRIDEVYEKVHAGETLV